MTREPGVWRELVLPGVSTLAAAATLSYALLTTVPGGEQPRSHSTPERAAQEFAGAYQARDYEAAARLAAGKLQRTLEHKARSARLQGASALGDSRSLVIEESFTLARNRLRFTGMLVSDTEADGNGWPVSITVARHGDRYLAEALQWPKGPPPDER